MRYPLNTDTGEVSPSPDLPALELATLAYWADDDTFRASVAARPDGINGSNEFVFYDGPPFANGLPHYGHLLTGYVKDVIPRYQTMRGKHVERRFGWDTHGLPAELEAERELGITRKSQIDEMGLAAFNEACRTSVLRYTREWQDYVTRQARWVDFDNDYKTLDVTYMESVMWAFKTLWDKGLIYDGHKVLWYCWRCGTPLSSSETKQDDAYRTRQDTAVTVGFTLSTGETALAWTTTPWTLPSNLALAVHPDVDYVTVEPETMPGQKIVMADARLGAYARELGENPTVLRRFKGRELAGTTYEPLFPYFAGEAERGAFRVLLADYVTTEDGTGLVHIAPAYGEDDKVVTDAAGIGIVAPIQADGTIDDTVPDFAGLNVFESNKPIIQALKANGHLVRQETFEHAYPHCWRCETPLIQRAVSSWFVSVTTFRDRLVELGLESSWCPAHVREGQWGKWLEGAIDWSISRNR